MEQRSKSQSAMEYLMTYGWAILIIAIVLGAMFSLGVFSSSSLLPSACTAQVGFLCQNPTLSTSGVYSALVGSTTPINVTAISCTVGSTTPSVWNSLTTNIILSGSQEATIGFQCPVSTNTLGSKFQGTLWIQYSIGSQTGLTSEVATVSGTSTCSTGCAAASGSGSSGPAPIYLYITVTNNQAATPTPFQQMISFNPSSAAYSSNEAGDLGNIRFYLGNGAPTSPLDSWCESGCSNSVSNAVFWVNLPSGIGGTSPSNVVIINMTFLSTSTEYTGVYAGEAPQLTCSNPAATSTCSAGSGASGVYGQWDNGNSVFNFYEDFHGGGTLDSKWHGIGSAGYTQSNGILLKTGGEEIISTVSYSDPLVIEYYGWDDQPSSTGSNRFLYDSQTNTVAEYSDNFWYQNNPSASDQFIFSSSGSGTSLLSTSSSLAGTSFNLYSISATSANVILKKNYAVWSSVINSNLGTWTSGYLGIGNGGTGGTGQYVQWYRARAYPPGNVMPGTSFGSVI